MKKPLRVFNHSFVSVGAFVVLVVGNLLAQGETNSVMGWDNGFVKTNGEFVTIGGIMVKTNSPLNTDGFKVFLSRKDKLLEAYESDSSANALDKFEHGVRLFQRDYPSEDTSYQLMMWAMGDRERSDPAKAYTLAQEMMDGPAPDNFKQWAKGFLHRLDCIGKPVTIQFMAADGREVDLAKMRGKVVLVDFWATSCGPCVAEIPKLKAVFERLHPKGFEIVGISCDTDRNRLAEFVKQKAIPWPQFFDGNLQTENRFGRAFGINGIPHMFLVDKKGCLRVDNLHAKGDFEEQITRLLAEQ